jgi:predicted Zn-dependent peptidase
MAGTGFDWRYVTLASGLRLITVIRPGTPTVAVRIYARAGSRYDLEHARPGTPPPPLGLAHFVEHLLFKGTRLHSSREIFAHIERLGGVLDAGTTREYTSFSAVTPPASLEVAVELLAEILSAPALPEDDFWNEKLVVLEEIRRAQDRANAIAERFAEALWQVNPLRTPLLGTLQGLYDLDYEDLVSFYRQRYVAGNMLVVVCGDVDHDKAGRLVAAAFNPLPVGPEQRPVPADEPPLDAPRIVHVPRDSQQVHLLIGVPGPGMRHPDRSALKVIERMLCMGASARLYQRLREEKHLVYNVSTLIAQFEDAGYFAVQTACTPENLAQVRQAILAEWSMLREQGVSADELSAARSNYAGTLARQFETNLSVAGILGVEGLLDRVETFEEAVARIGTVGRDDVVRVAREYLNPERYVAVSMGRATVT